MYEFQLHFAHINKMRPTHKIPILCYTKRGGCFCFFSFFNKKNHRFCNIINRCCIFRSTYRSTRKEQFTAQYSTQTTFPYFILAPIECKQCFFFFCEIQLKLYLMKSYAQHADTQHSTHAKHNINSYVILCTRIVYFQTNEKKKRISSTFFALFC